ncbi:MAG: futalosine hydrolase [Chitinophagaceae bacterium]
MPAKCEICRMGILLVAATAHEIQPTLNRSHGMDILITGVGSIQTCYHLHKKLKEGDYDFVLQAGIAGVFSNKLPLGTVVGVSDDCFGDLGFEESDEFIPLFQTKLLQPNEFPFENGKLVNRMLSTERLGLEVASAVTVNKVSDSTRQMEQLCNFFNPAVESMEGAAFHYVCLQQKIPFLQLRAISNHVGERDKSKWILKEAIINLDTAINRITNILQKFPHTSQ